MAVLESAAEAAAPSLNWKDGLPLLVTPQVVLRELRLTDAPALRRVVRTPAVARFAWPAPSSVDAFESFITWAWRQRAEGKYACFAIVPRDGTEPAGVFELRALQPGFYRAELGLLLEPGWWNNGVFEEGMRLVCAFAFGTVAVHRVEIRTSVNDASCNGALAALGVEREAVLRSAFVHGGGFEDQILWSVVKGLDPLAGAP